TRDTGPGTGGSSGTVARAVPSSGDLAVPISEGLEPGSSALCRPTSDRPLPTHQQRFPLLFVLHPLLHSLNGPRWNTVLDAFLSPRAGNGRYRGGKGAGPAGEGRGTALGEPRARGGGAGYRSGE